MSRYKRLELPTWATLDDTWLDDQDFEACVNGPHETVFGKHGYYFDRDTGACWIECPRGSWEVDSTHFLYDLEQLHHRPLSDDQRKAIQTLLEYRRDKKLQRLLWTDTCWRQHRDTIRETRLWILKTSKPH